MTTCSYFRHLAQKSTEDFLETRQESDYVELFGYLEKATVHLNWCGHRIVRIEEHTLHLKDLLNLIANHCHLILPFPPPKGGRWDPDCFERRFFTQQHITFTHIGRLFKDVEKEKENVIQSNTFAKILMIVCLFFQTGRLFYWGPDIPNRTSNRDRSGSGIEGYFLYYPLPGEK